MKNHNKFIRILIVHSSAEMYGSDRSLLDFVRHRGLYIQVTVALPNHGILVKELEAAGAKVIVGEVCKIQRDMFSLHGMFGTVLSAFRTIKFLKSAHINSQFDIVYSNTVAVFGGSLYARFYGIPHVWHVREILEGSKILTYFFRHLVGGLSSTVICNSQKTLDWIKPNNKSNKYKVIWNGFDAPNVDLDRVAERSKLDLNFTDILFVLVGRINAWKGQKLLIEAFASLAPDIGSCAQLAIVGSAPSGKEHYETELVNFVEKLGLSNRVKFIPYRSDIESIWVAADVVVIPSTEPEPFGRVAIEAMGFKQPVIAANHGGLMEIIVDGVTGRLVAPRDAKALATAMSEMICDAGLRKRMGEAGFLRQRALFSVSSYISQLTDVMNETVVGLGKRRFFKFN